MSYLRTAMEFRVGSENRRRGEEQYKYQTILEETLSKLLGHFVSICCVCGKVRIPVTRTRSKETWLPLKSYISNHSEIVFSHGYCPECETALYNDINDRSIRLHSQIIKDTTEIKNKHKT